MLLTNKEAICFLLIISFIERTISAVPNTPLDFKMFKTGIRDEFKKPHKSTNTINFTEITKISNSKCTLEIYSTNAFKEIRKAFKVNIAAFETAIISDLYEIPNPAKSGARLYKTADGSILIKTMSINEIKYFFDYMLATYFKHVAQNPATLLVQIYGIFGFTSPNMSKTVVFLMKNCFPNPNQMPMNEIYDLKGSTINREVKITNSKTNSNPLLDLNFLANYPRGIKVRNDIYDLLVTTLTKDLMTLELLQISDYSFLMGIHIVNGRSNPREKITNFSAGFPATDEYNNNFRIFIRIIDIMEYYGSYRMGENITKLGLFRNTTMQSPSKYASRLAKLIKERVFYTNSK